MPGKIKHALRKNSWLLLAAAICLSALFLTVYHGRETAGSVSLTPVEKAWLDAHPVITLAPDPDFPPTEFYDANGRYTGIAADYVAMIQEKLGVRFRIVKPRSWTDALRKARQREVDVLAAVTKTPERSGYLLFTRPYLEFPAVIVTRKNFKGPLDLQSLAGKKVAIKAGYAARYYVVTNYPRIQVDIVPDTLTGLGKVSDGTDDAMLENLFSTSYYMEKEAISNLRIAGEAEFVYRPAFGVRNDWPVLQGILDKGLAAVSPGEREVIYHKWVPLGSRFLLVNKKMTLPILLGCGLLLAVFILVFLWNWSLTRRVAVKTRQLNAELHQRAYMESALRESEQKFRVLAETSPSAIFLHQGESLVYVNPAATKLTGFPEQEILSMKFWEWMDPDFRDQVKTYGLARQQGESVPELYESKIRTRDGGSKWVLISAGRITYHDKPAGIAFVLDISDRKRAEDELRRANEGLEQRVAERTAELGDRLEKLRLAQFAVEKSSDQAFWVKEDGKFLYVNHSACRALGYTREELLGMAVPDVDPVFNFADHGELWRDLREKRTLTFESRHRAKDGRTYPVEIRCNFLCFDGNEYNCCFVTDISERKNAEESLRKAHDELDERVRERTGQLTSLAAELSRAEEFERRRIATELHDQVAQTLALSKIKLNILLLSEQNGIERETLGEIVDHLTTSIEEIRSLTFQLSPPILHDVGLGAALEWLADEFRDKYGLSIRIRDGGDPGLLDADMRGALYWMSRELLINIVKHAQAKSVLVELKTESGIVRIGITDDGIGFDPSRVLRCGNSGNSFGLLNIHHRIRHLGGEFRIDSAPSRGTTATLTLPGRITSA
jgi:PAS domain S-box-containing protein